MMRTTSMLSTTLALALLAIGCNKEEPKAAKIKDEDEALQGPPIKVELPPKPNFDEGKTVEKYEDGSYSVYGLRDKIDENVKAGEAATEVTVRAYVQDIYVPPPCPEGQACPPGKQPHVWVVDNPAEQGKKRAMMVVNYRFQIPEWDAKRWKGIPEVVLEKGKQYTFKGKFLRFSSSGFAADNGLLEFVAYEVANPKTGVKEWIAPPGAPWHPAEIARQEESNASLVERAAQSAADYKKGKK